MPSSQAKGVLRNSSLFAVLSEPELDALAARAAMRSFGAGELLFSEGDPCAGLYIVVRGRVRIFKSSPDGREQVLSIEGPGGSIAELPVFDGGPYPASVSALEPSDLVFLAREDFRALCLENPEVGLKVLQVVGARLRRLVGIIEELSFSTVRHRLISWIIRESKANGATFTMNTSHQELAAQIGTVRELVSRNLARLQAQGFIAIHGRELSVTDAGGLEAELAQ